MDLLNIILNPSKAEGVCCLCFKENKNSIGLHDRVEIHDEYFNFYSTIGSIMKSLFPSHDIALTHICEDCSSLIIKMFSLLQRSVFKNDMLHYLLNNLDEEIEEMEYNLVCKRKLQKCRLKVNLPSKSIMNSQNSRSIQCIKCQMKFKSKLLLKRHSQISHKNTNNAIICDICGKEFKKNSTLLAHLGCHKQKQCPYCFKTLKSHSHFNLHVKNHMSQVKCKRNAKYHECSHCHYRSLYKCSLEAHTNKVHLNIKPFNCDSCQKGFYKKDNLVQHLVTHNKIKDKTCHICGDAFGIEKTLQEHLKLHSGQKPFKCDICNIGFVTSGRRHEHIKRKHMEKTECCVICGKTFSLKKDLNSHLKKVHGAETKNYIFKVDLDNIQPDFEVVKVINYNK